MLLHPSSTLRGRSKDLFFGELEAPSECCWKLWKTWNSLLNLFTVGHSSDPQRFAVSAQHLSASVSYCLSGKVIGKHHACQLLPWCTLAAGIKEKKPKMTSSLRICLCQWYYKGLSQAQLVSKYGDFVFNKTLRLMFLYLLFILNNIFFLPTSKYSLLFLSKWKVRLTRSWAFPFVLSWDTKFLNFSQEKVLFMMRNKELFSEALVQVGNTAI